MIMKKILSISMLVLMILVLMNGCTPTIDQTVTTIDFPASDFGKTEYNASAFEITPFSVSFSLPDKWSTEELQTTEDYEFLSAFSKHIINNENGLCVGVVGYNVYEPLKGGEDDPRAIYSQLALGNNYQFDVRNTYEVAKETANGITEVVDVMYSASINDGKEKQNIGVLSYNRDLLVYIAFEFESSALTSEQIDSIAKSVTFI